MTHDDLIKRLQNSAIEAGMPDEIAREIGKKDPWEGFGEPDNQFRSWSGEQRWEILAPVRKILSAVERFFSKKEK